MAALGVTYVVDPASPYAEASDGLAVDFLRFPRETVSHRAGDCDDLAVLYCALLEAIGVRTALVTIPGHIFAAVDLEMSVAEARRVLFNDRDLLLLDGEAWLPVEVTLLHDGFAVAWRTAAEEWRAHPGERGFYVVRDAWERFPPVSLEAPRTASPQVPSGALIERYRADVSRILEQELLPMASALRERTRQRGESARLLNALGVLYARYDQLAEARELFEAAVSLEGYAPALANLGNIHLLTGELERARTAYEEALRILPESPAALLGLSRVHYELERYVDARAYYDRLEAAAPNLAADYAYLAVTTLETRAAGPVPLRPEVSWVEEETE
jgi:tetratricopeptide (TPR) repeat protein